jgi:hypothetical protein
MVPIPWSPLPQTGSDMPESTIIPGLKLILHNAGGINEPEDPSYPYKLEAIFSPPKFMSFAFVMLHGGSEEVVVQAMTREALDEFIRSENLLNHPRLLHMTITGPEGVDILK